VARCIGEVDVEHDHVSPAALGEAGLERLAEPEVARVVDHADAIGLGGEFPGDAAGFVAAAVVDDDQLEAVRALQRPQVVEQHVHVVVQDRGLVVGRQDDRDERALRGGGAEDFVDGETAAGRSIGARRVRVGRIAGRHDAHSLPGAPEPGRRLRRNATRAPIAHDRGHISGEMPVNPASGCPESRDRPRH
jgi:hypothetical protein